MIRLAVTNTADKPQAARAATRAAEYVCLNEARAAVDRFVNALAKGVGWDSWSPRGSQNTHMWKPGSVGVVTRGRKVLVLGGRRGAGKARSDRRRRGPTRDEPWQLVYDVDTHGLVIIRVPHLPARSTTSEKWRYRALMLPAFARMRAQTAWLAARFPGVPQIILGDGNVPRLGSWRLSKRSWRAIHTPPDFGRRHYTQVYVKGNVSISRVTEFHSVSDHDGLSMDLVIGDDAPQFRGLVDVKR